MSYILDALKKSEQQRLASGVPNLHCGQSQAVGAGASQRNGWVLALVLVGINLAALGWWFGSRPSAPAPTARLAEAPPPPAAPHPGPPPLPTPSAVPTQPSPAGSIAQAPSTAAHLQPLPHPSPKTLPSEPAAPVTAATARANPPASPAAAQWPTVAPAPKSSETEVIPPAPPRGIVAYGDLPASVRNAMPPLKIGGYINGDGDAMLVVDDRLVREGDEIGPGVKVVKISPEGSVFSFRNYRFRR